MKHGHGKLKRYNLRGLAIATTLLLGLAVAIPAAQAADEPNVILLVTDDMGWGDPGSYGFDRGVKTPALDELLLHATSALKR